MNTETEFYTMTDLALMLNGINRRLERIEQALHETPKIHTPKTAKKQNFKDSALAEESGGLGGIIGGEIRGECEGREEGGKKGGGRGFEDGPQKVSTLIAEKCHLIMARYLSGIELKRVQSAAGLRNAANEVAKLLKTGYTEAQIVQAVTDATNEPFWRKQFRSMLKLTRKNKDGVPYIDVFLALNQKNHKLPSNRPKIIV